METTSVRDAIMYALEANDLWPQIRVLSHLDEEGALWLEAVAGIYDGSTTQLVGYPVATAWSLRAGSGPSQRRQQISDLLEELATEFQGDRNYMTDAITFDGVQFEYIKE